MIKRLYKTIAVVLSVALVVTSIPADALALRPMAHRTHVVVKYSSAETTPPNIITPTVLKSSDLESVKKKSSTNTILANKDEKKPFHKRSWRNGGAAPLLVIVMLFVVVLAVGLFIYDVYLLFNLIGFFRAPPFAYGWFKSIVVGFTLSSIIGSFVGSFFVGSFFGCKSKDKDKEEDWSGSEEEAIVVYLLIVGGAALISLPFILSSNWGAIGTGIALGVNYFTAWKFHYLLGGLLVLSAILQVIFKLRGYSNGHTWGYRIINALVATFVAPIGEEVLFRFAGFNISKWFLTSVLDFTTSISYTLPLFGYSIGFGLPLGIFMAICLNADSFFKAHGRAKWFHNWLMGAIACYSYYKTGTLLVPIVIHFIWNGIVSIVDLILNTIIPLEEICLPEHKGQNVENATQMNKGDSLSTSSNYRLKTEKFNPLRDPLARLLCKKGRFPIRWIKLESFPRLESTSLPSSRPVNADLRKATLVSFTEAA